MYSQCERPSGPVRYLDHTTRGSGSHVFTAGSHKTHRHGIAVEGLPFFVASAWRPRRAPGRRDVPLRRCHVGPSMKRAQLLELMRTLPSCAVAFSAGVDSSVVAKAAALALGDRAVAVTGVSPSLADGELEEARRMAQLIGIRHLEIDTDEMSQPQYAENSPDRCYHCKTELYLQHQGPAAALAGGRDRQRCQCRRSVRLPARHAGRQGTAGAQPAGRMRPDQERCAGPGQGSGSCRSGTSRPRLACRAGLPMASR